MKRFISLLLCLVLLFSLVACGGGNGNSDEGQEVDNTVTKMPEIKDDEAVGEGTSYSEFLQVMTEIKELGDATNELVQPVQSEYYYSFAGASVGALRYAAEYILWLKGEGDTLASFTADSAYTGWDKIASINYSSPYPAYFKGMVLLFQGKNEEAKEPLALSAMMPMFPEEGLNFAYLKNMEKEALYELRDALREFEDALYQVYTPENVDREWDFFLYDEEYVINMSRNCLNEENPKDALFYAKQGLKANPFEASHWKSAVYCAMYAEEWKLMGAYIDEGLVLFPEDEALLGFKEAIKMLAEDIEKKAE